MMRLQSIWSRLSVDFGRGSRKRRRIGPLRRPPASTALRVEALEERWAPAVLTVQTTSDTGINSLRAAIQAANVLPDADTIVFTPGLAGKTIQLTTGELLITSPLTIQGLGADQLTIDGGHAGRIFEVAGGATVNISGLKLTNGLDNQGGGGAIRNAGTLSLSACWLDSDVAQGETGGNGLAAGSGGGGGGAAGGGGIFNSGTLNLVDSTLSNNAALGGGGGAGSGTGGNGGGGGRVWWRPF